MPFEVFVGGELDTKLPDPSREYVLQFKLFRKGLMAEKPSGSTQTRWKVLAEPGSSMRGKAQSPWMM